MDAGAPRRGLGRRPRSRRPSPPAPALRRRHRQLVSVYRLERKMIKRQRFEALRLRLGFDLWVYELQLIPVDQPQRRVRLGAHTDPVDSPGCELGPVRLDRDLESARVEGVYQGVIELEQRLAAGADDERRSMGADRPDRGYAVCQRVRVGELSTVRPDTDEVRVAEGAHGAMAIVLAARPQVAPAEAAEHRGSAAVKAFALKRVEDFLDDVGHPKASGANEGSCRSKVDPSRWRAQDDDTEWDLRGQLRGNPSDAGGTPRTRRTRCHPATDRSSSSSPRNPRRVTCRRG